MLVYLPLSINRASVYPSLLVNAETVECQGEFVNLAASEVGMVQRHRRTGATVTVMLARSDSSVVRV